MTASKRLCFCVIYSIILHNVGTLNIYDRERRFCAHDKCHGVQTTFEKVLTCPENDDILLKRLSRKKCDSFPQCQREPLVYHCVRFEGGLVEVCAPRDLIAGHYCAVFEEGIGRVVGDYFNPCPECPSIYSSDESFKYLKCVQRTMKAPTYQTSTEQTNVLSTFNEAFGSPTIKTFRTTIFGGTTMNGLYPTRETENGEMVCPKISVYVMVLVVNGVIITVGLIVCCCLKQQQKFCLCARCDGKWVSVATFHRHEKEHLKFFTIPTIPKFPFKEDVLKDSRYNEPLFSGSQTTLLDAVTKHMYIFSMNHGMSKSAVTDSLACEKSSLPQPNLLPKSFREARSLVSPLLMPLEKFDACLNDCILYRDSEGKKYAGLKECPICHEPRQKNGLAQKKFTYMPIGPRLSRWFGTPNLCKLLYAKKVTVNGTLRDFTDGKVYQSWFEEGGVFHGMKESHTIPLSLFTDGVNPNKHMTSQKSMWPIILTWINLPFELRQLLGPMLLVGIIPSGLKGNEPKSLEPYLELVTDEIIQLTEFPVFSSYAAAPVTVKVALLQFLCDIPAFSKVFHLSGHGALRSCPYCREVGHRCKHLNKTIHLSNRRFLDSNHPLRCEGGFGEDGPDNQEKPAVYSNEEELSLREQYESKPNKSQKTKFQKETGLKGKYTFLRLPYHNRIKQMQPDGMHTFADFINHVFEMLTGKLSNQKVKNCELSFGRFEDDWKEENDLENRPIKKRKTTATTDSAKTSAKEVKFHVPWALSKDAVKEADKRASEIIYGQTNDITPGPHFSKPWTLRTMNSKLQFVITGGLQWCLRGLLPQKQEETLFFLLNTLKRVISPAIQQADIEELQNDVHYALCLLERDFPLSLQNLTTHLIHHIVDGLEEFGPVYGRWLFPYERANGWISRQCLRKGVEKSTVMETYVIYDWCVHMVLSQQFKPSKIFSSDNKLVQLSEKLMMEILEEPQHEEQRPSPEIPVSNSRQLTPQMIQHMTMFYTSVLNMNVLNFDETVVENTKSCEHVDNYGRSYQFVGKWCKRRQNSVVKVPCSSGTLFGEIVLFLCHKVNNIIHKWVVLDIFPLAEKEKGFFHFENKVVCQRLCHISTLSRPLAHVRTQSTTLWMLEEE